MATGLVFGLLDALPVRFGMPAVYLWVLEERLGHRSRPELFLVLPRSLAVVEESISAGDRV